MRLAQAEFEKIRLEEELRTVREQGVQKSFQLRHMEEMQAENEQLEKKVGEMRSEVERVRQEAEYIRQSATEEVKQVRAEMAEAKNVQPAIDPAQKAELMAAIAKLNNELQEVRIKNEELVQQVKQS